VTALLGEAGVATLPPMTWTPDDKVMADLRNWLIDQGFVVPMDQYDGDHLAIRWSSSLARSASDLSAIGASGASSSWDRMAPGCR
jgi:hypothetical protein